MSQTTSDTKDQIDYVKVSLMIWPYHQLVT